VRSEPWHDPQIQGTASWVAPTHVHLWRAICARARPPGAHRPASRPEIAQIGAMSYASASERAQPGSTSGYLPELFTRPGALESLRPPTKDEQQILASMETPGFLEVYPRSGDKRPVLYSKLEAMLTEKIRTAERLVAPGPGQRQAASLKSMGAANLRLDAHRQVFEAFIQAFATYRPLLRRIKDEYETVLDDGLRASHENVIMRAELAVAEQRKHRAVEEARAEAAASAASLRAELHARLIEAEERARRAEAREARLEAEGREMRTALGAAREELGTVRGQMEELRRLMAEESSFHKAAQGSEALAGLKVGGPAVAEEARRLREEEH